MRQLIACFLLTICLINVISECIDGCSGHGQCTEYDMCLCDRNWQGNDCKERKNNLIPELTESKDN